MTHASRQDLTTPANRAVGSWAVLVLIALALSAGLGPQLGSGKLAAIDQSGQSRGSHPAERLFAHQTRVVTQLQTRRQSHRPALIAFAGAQVRRVTMACIALPAGTDRTVDHFLRAALTNLPPPARA
jgi:hypothetical protein